MTRSTLFTPPQLYRNVKFHRHSNRSIGWLELFYDLVYVATLIQIGNYLSDNVNLIGFGHFIVILTVVWWAWTGETIYQNRYVVDDLTHRLLVFTQMFAVASLGISVSGAFGNLYVQFTLAYVLIRSLLVIMYIRAARNHPESRELSRGYVIGFGLGVVIWLGSLLLPSDIHWVGWLIGIAVELSIPLLPQMRKHQLEWGLDVAHISERFGIFTIIVLGESFVKVLDDAQGAVIGAQQLLFSLFGLTVVYSLWWLYFTDTAGKIINVATRFRTITWLYGHLPLAAGLVAFGVAAKKLFGAEIEHPGEALDVDYRLLYTAAVVLYLLALALIDLGLEDEQTKRNQPLEALVHVIAAGITLIMGLAWTEATPTGFVLMIAVIMLIQVFISIQQSQRSTKITPTPREPEVKVSPGD